MKCVFERFQQMLVCDPEARITPEEALKHPFVAGKSRLVVL